MTAEELLQIMPNAGANAEIYAAPLTAAMAEFNINTPTRQAAFLAQIAHESSQLAHAQENLNYRPQAILSTFNTVKRTRFTAEQAEQYGRTANHPANQVMIANIAYANRNGNGDVASGDGWTYRGAGLIQLTFRSNHEACADFFDVPHKAIGAWLRAPEGACRSAGRFWQKNGLNELADAGEFESITLKINGGLRGQDDRVALWDSARETLGLA